MAVWVAMWVAMWVAVWRVGVGGVVCLVCGGIPGWLGMVACRVRVRAHVALLS